MGPEDERRERQSLTLTCLEEGEGDEEEEGVSGGRRGDRRYYRRGE